MKTMKRTCIIKTIFLVNLFFIFFAGGCKKFVEVPEPEDQILTKDVFENEQTTVSAVTGMYGQMMRTALFFSNAGMSIYPSLSADELFNTSPNADLDLFTANSLNSGMAVLL